MNYGEQGPGSGSFEKSRNFRGRSQPEVWASVSNTRGSIRNNLGSA